MPASWVAKQAHVHLNQSFHRLCLAGPATVVQEAAMMCALRHANVARFFGICILPPSIVTGAA